VLDRIAHVQPDIGGPGHGDGFLPSVGSSIDAAFGDLGP
jgi:hypothetical protein